MVNNKKIIDWLDPSFFTSNMASARLPTLRIFKSTVFLNKVASQLFCSGSIALGIHDKATVFLKESDIGFKFALKKDCLVLNNSPLVKKLCEMGLEGKFKLIFKEFENLYVLLKI